MTTVFTVEKTLRRTLRQLIVSAGFSSAMADKLIGSLRGLNALKEAWELYDPRHRKLTTLIQAADWKSFKDAVEMRNNLVHGVRVYNLSDCQRQATETLNALNNAKSFLNGEYGYSGWTTASRRITGRLHQDPKISWTK
ncbi:MAG: hypothetical protein P0Y64_18505 [Candidatus Sphingomonas colombiensis]|nr:hypothetical protein [Sphingomonas sp.]WEK43282.1 MAG: hypothetical protein P0Y64_18505 [Sphingomonas sp.]